VFMNIRNHPSPNAAPQSTLKISAPELIRYALIV